MCLAARTVLRELPHPAPQQHPATSYTGTGYQSHTPASCPHTSLGVQWAALQQ